MSASLAGRSDVRCAANVVIFFALFFVGLPALSARALGETRWISPNRSWGVLLVLQVAAIVGLSAIQEFSGPGQGTPFPLDPPRRLVVTGPYAYVANPMQVCKVVCLLFWGFFLGNAWLLLASLLYAGFTAVWTAPREDEALERRFGGEFQKYRASARRWWPRWKSRGVARGRFYVAEGCGVCAGLGRWMRERNPIGLEIVAAESHPSRALTRMTYERDGSEESGLAAFARALEHCNLAWAFLGWTLRLPGLGSFSRLLVDAVGVAGPAAPLRETSTP